MNTGSNKQSNFSITFSDKVIIALLCMIFIFPFDVVSATHNKKVADAVMIAERDVLADTVPVAEMPETLEIVDERQITADVDSVAVRDGIDMSMIEPMDSVAVDSITNVVTFDDMPAGFSERKVFMPNPSRAVWLSALLPGLGQIYNRRYWKIPIVIGGFMGLGYATSWNNGQLQDYTQAYRDLTDSDPATNSYMNFFPPNTSESDFDKAWLEATMKSRKDYYRRNRDLCIICLVGLYLLCMVDAYVDASLAHFDISDNLSLNVQPAMFLAPTDRKVALGLNWAFNF